MSLKQLVSCPITNASLSSWHWVCHGPDMKGDLSDLPSSALGLPLTIKGMLSSSLLHCIKCLQVVKLKVFIPVQQVQLQLKPCLGRRISLWQLLQETPKIKCFGNSEMISFLLVYFSCFPTPGSLTLPKIVGNAPPQVP